MLYEKHKEKLKFRIGVLVDNPTEKKQGVSLFSVWQRHLTNPEVRLIDYYCNHLFDDGSLSFLNNYIMANPIKVILTIIRSENTNQLKKLVVLRHTSSNGTTSSIPTIPYVDNDPMSFAPPRESKINYSYLLDPFSSVEIEAEPFTSVLIEFVPEKSQKEKFENSQSKFYDSLGKETSIAYSKDKKKYLFICN